MSRPRSPRPRRPGHRVSVKQRAPRRGKAADPVQARSTLDALVARYPRADCALVHKNAFELLVATILSAQCTDARVNQVTPHLFARWPTAAALAEAEPAELEAVVRPTGFFRSKAKSLKAMAQRLVQEFGGEVPRSMDELLTLRGVARKTANVVRGVVWGLADGVVVDTHVGRIARRLGWTRHEDPVKVERDLMALFPRESWIALSHVLIHHGRDLCAALRPRCAACPVAAACPAALPGSGG
jgi:endonuclease III